MSVRPFRAVAVAIRVGILCFVITAPAAMANQRAVVSVLEQHQQEVISLVERALPSVVTIKIHRPASTAVEEDKKTEPGNTEPNEKEKNLIFAGSGFFVNNNGLVVTNNHVVAGAIGGSIRVVLHNEVEIAGTIVGTDILTDIALIKVNVADIPAEKRSFTSATWGDSDRLRQGATVIAIGSPFGLANTVTKGVVSALDRYWSSLYIPYIQHDAAMNRGNSGGPLFNIYGEIVGINTAILSMSGDNAGISFAVPSDTARRVVGELAAFGRVKRGYIGIQVQNVTEEISKELKAPSEGAFVTDIVAGGPAHRAGVRKDDIIVSVNGVVVKNIRDLLHAVAEAPIGTAIPIKVWRNDTVITLYITPLERPCEMDDEIPAEPPTLPQLPKENE